jgi:CRP/FNR family transcriptional regulator, cyclic AMP receptor protein
MFDGTVRPLLALEPDLGRLLSSERESTAEQELSARVFTLDPGAWHPEALCAAEIAGNIGLLVLDGVVLREICLHDAPSGELLGAGDIIRTWQADAPAALMEADVRWAALSQVSVALLDRSAALALRRYPEVMTVVLDRINARAERLAVTQAISQITGVETRVEALLWHLAERWGRVGPDGVLVDLALSHRMIASLVGARRPTVSTALTRLSQEGRVSRRVDGAWLLAGSRPPARLRANDMVTMDSEFVSAEIARSLGGLAVA